MSESIDKLVGEMVHEGVLKQATNEELIKELYRRLLVAGNPENPPIQTSDDDWVSPAEAARRLSVSRATVYRMFRSKLLTSKVVGKRCRRISVDALRRLVGAR